MCIAILQKENVTLDRNLLKNCWRNNPHGAGLLWTKNGELHHFKELKSLKTFIRKYEALTEEIGRFSKIVLHFRIATHGFKDHANCHPHFVSDKLAFVHNGIIRVPVARGSEKSDTVLFNENVLQKLPVGFLDNIGVQELLMQYTSGSKLVFLTAENVSYIVHENDGHWVNNVWFSNHSYKDRDWFSSFNIHKEWQNEERLRLLNTETHRFQDEAEDQCLSCGGFLDTPIALEYGYCNDCLNLYYKDDLVRDLVCSK